MKIKVCVGCDVASYTHVEMEASEFNLEHVKRKVSKLLDDGELQFQPEDPNSPDYQSGQRIVYAKSDTDEELCDFVPLEPAYFEYGQDAMHALRRHLTGEIDSDELVDELVRLAHVHNTYPIDLQQRAVELAVAGTEQQAPNWAF